VIWGDNPCLYLAKAKGLKKVDFSAKVWPETSPKAAYARWTVMRGKADKTDRPQGVLISDAQCMAEVLDEDLAYLLLRAKDRVRQKMEREKETVIEAESSEGPEMDAKTKAAVRKAIKQR
jgi:hypothetical protein